MKTTKLFKLGNSQAVRLPKEFHFGGNRVFIKRIGKAVVLFSSERPWATLLDSLSLFSEDFMSERSQPPTQNRVAQSTPTSNAHESHLPAGEG